LRILLAAQEAKDPADAEVVAGDIELAVVLGGPLVKDGQEQLDYC